MKKKPIALLVPILLGLAQADTFKLKDGTKLEGTIISETDDSYIALVQVTPSIRDQRTIAKADVVAVIPEAKDEKEFPEIKELVPTPDLLEPGEYEARIKQVEKFIETYPESFHKSAAENIAKTLKEEYAVIKNGGVKYDGELISADDRQGDAYGFDARLAFADFKQLVDDNQYVAALRAWDELAEKFPTTQAYKDSVPIASVLIKELHSKLGDEVRSFEERKTKRAEDFKKLPTQDKPRTKQAIEDQMAKYEAQLEEEKQAGERWISVNVWHLDAMREMRGTLAQEFQKLKELDVSAISDGGKAYQEAYKTLKGEPDAEAAAAALKSAQEAGVPEPYLQRLQQLAPEGTTGS